MRLLAIDGNSILNRAFYGIKILTNKKGIYTNAIYGFMSIYLKEASEIKPDMTAVAFDLKAPTFRHKAVETYKANRKGMPNELAQQLPLIKELLEGMGIAVLEKEGYEADDILGTLALKCAESANECTILTGDRDSLQLINDNVEVRLATTKAAIIYDNAKFIEDYGFAPQHLIDLKALMGDASDNIKGVAGIGEKTAKKLIIEWQDIENIYKNIDKIDMSAGIITKLRAGEESAKESKWLATIKTDVELDFDITKPKPQEMDTEKVSKLLAELEIFSLFKRLGLEINDSSAIASEKETKQLEYTVSELTDADISRFMADNQPVCYTFSKEKLCIADGDKILCTEDSQKFSTFFTNSVEKYTFSAKNDYKYCMENGIKLQNMVFDAEIAGYLLNSASTDYSVPRLCAEYDCHFYSELNDYAEIASLPQLAQSLMERIETSGEKNLFDEIELPLTQVLASMEYCGIKVNAQGVREFGSELTADLSHIQADIYDYAGHEFNISSPKQLGVVLFEELGMPNRKKTKTGYSTNAEVLEELRTKHPIVEKILQYRQLFKLNSTYVEGLLKTVEDDGRIHTIFKQTETRTGRISSTEPNMQNIPVRTDLGKNMRKFFIADEGKILIDADYSQIELRILAHLCGDENMINAFETGEDIHTATAAQVFKMPKELVTPSMRTYAKAVNFGIIYGIGAFSLSKDIGVSVAEADQYIKEYLAHYPKVAQFMAKTVEDAQNNGFVTTMFGRRRYVPELASSNKNIQAAGRRIAMNTPIQGSAADIIKIAMVRVHKRLADEMLDAQLILQVHDELIVESSLECAEQAAEILSAEMQNAAKLSVPLTADVSKGLSWYDAKA